jgi:GT2 family glycosyltransferase
VKKRFLQNHGLFDEDFPYAAWEDVELAFRLSFKGLRIVYEDKALAYHEHPVNGKSLVRRSRLMGRAMAIFHKKHPEAKEVIKPIRTLCPKLFKMVPLWCPPSFIAEWIPKRHLHAYYNCLITRHIETGYHDEENVSRGTERVAI